MRRGVPAAEAGKMPAVRIAGILPALVGVFASAKLHLSRSHGAGRQK